MPYPSDHKTLSAFFAARITESPSATMGNTEFGAAVEAWCASRGVPPISHRRASRYLLALGYRQHSNRTHGRRWAGLSLR